MSNKIYKIDLHSHSILSYDGGINEAGYNDLLASHIVDFIAITDHNEISFALRMREKLGEQIIVGEEIMTKDGEIIGLFLKNAIPFGLTARETIQLIQKQGGLVYIPHPFETRRKGLPEKCLINIVKSIDIIEVFNGRALFFGKSQNALSFARLYKKTMAASSDAHIIQGVGRTFSAITQVPKSTNLRHLLGNAQLHKEHAPFLTLLAPSANKLKHRLFKTQ